MLLTTITVVDASSGVLDGRQTIAVDQRVRLIRHDAVLRDAIVALHHAVNVDLDHFDEPLIDDAGVWIAARLVPLPYAVERARERTTDTAVTGTTTQLRARTERPLENRIAVVRGHQRFQHAGLRHAQRRHIGQDAGGNERITGNFVRHGISPSLGAIESL